MHTKKSLLLVVAASMLLSGCGGKGSGNSTNSEKELTPVEKVIASIGDTFAFSSELAIRQFYGTPGALEEDSFTQLSEVYVSKSTAVTKTSFADDDEVSVTRYDKDDEGFLSTYMLNFTNNEVECIPYVYSGTNEPAPYSEAFANPFKDSADDWEDDGNGTLTYKGGDDATFNEGMFISLTSFYGTGDLSELKITYDKDTRVATGFTAHDLEDNVMEPEPDMIEMGFGEAFESGQELTLTATFTDPTKYEIPDVPEAVAAQEGQSALDDVFKELRKGNYTATYEYKGTGWEYNEEIDDVVPVVVDATSKVYFTPTTYYFEGAGVGTDPNYGGFVNSDGKLQKFSVDEYSGAVKFTAKPIGGLDHPYEYFFSTLFSYCGQVFNVEEDGTYTLPNISGLYEQELVGGAFGPDSITIGNFAVVPGSLKLQLTDTGLVYEYETSRGPVKCTITDIGSTTFGVDVSSATPYVPLTDIFQWLVKTQNYDLLGFVSALTAGQTSLVPFVEPAGNYQIQKVTRYLHDDETDTDTPYYYSFELYCECTSMADYLDYENEFKAAADANDKLTWDEETGGYIYTAADGTQMWEVYGQNFEQVTGQKFTDLWGRSYEQTFVLVIENLNVPDEIKNMWND